MDQQFITIATAAGTAFVTKGIEGPINSFNDLWDGVIGHRLKAWSEERKIKAFEDVNKLQIDIANRLNKIPQEFLKDPEISIVGPALESAKYYCDKDTLREMFAKVIASSMDNRVSSNVHQSFVEIIKQLSPEDASLLTDFVNSSRLPIADIVLVLNGGSQHTLFKLYFLRSENDMDYTSNSVIISNLIRLGLLFSPGELSSLANKASYTILRDSPFLVQLKNDYPQGQAFGESLISEVKLQESFVELTPYGSAFINITIK